jgi:beta-galactosidase/beta-glucuronidase
MRPRDHELVMTHVIYNAVRMSNYPRDEQFLDVCDEEGLYVLAALGGWQNFGPRRQFDVMARRVEISGPLLDQRQQLLS